MENGLTDDLARDREARLLADLHAGEEPDGVPVRGDVVLEASARRCGGAPACRRRVGPS